MADGPPNPPEKASPPSPGAGSPVHRRLTTRSAVNTLLFYGSVVVLCLLLPVLVALSIGVFFLFFYKREIAAFLRAPLRRTRMRADPADGSPYRLEPYPPGTFDTDRREGMGDGG